MVLSYIQGKLIPIMAGGLALSLLATGLLYWKGQIQAEEISRYQAKNEELRSSLALQRTEYSNLLDQYYSTDALLAEAFNKLTQRDAEATAWETRYNDAIAKDAQSAAWAAEPVPRSIIDLVQPDAGNGPEDASTHTPKSFDDFPAYAPIPGYNEWRSRAIYQVPAESRFTM